MEVDNARGGKVDTGGGSNAAAPSSERNFNGDGARDKRGESSTTGLESSINKGMRRYLISDKMVSLLNNQLQDEMINHNLYRSFSLYFRSRGIETLSEYFELRAKEELEHHEWIYKYLRTCGIPLQYPEIPATNVDVDNELTPFKLTVDKEIETTLSINEIAKVALEEGDYGTFAWLNGTGMVEGKLIPEQTEEMAISNEVMRIANRNDADWIAKGESILKYYKNTRP